MSHKILRPRRAAASALVLSISLLGAGIAGMANPAAAGGLAPGCTIGALNRSVRVDPAGRWVLNNVPANRGLVRARAVCVENGVVRRGQSDLFSIVPNGSVQVPSIQFDQVDPVPRSVALTAPAAPFRAPGENAQLRLQALYPDGTTLDVTSRAGIAWSSSNPRVVAVNTNGVATAMASGVALLSGLYEGTAGMALVRVELSGDSDGDGIPDDVEVANGLDPNSPADGFEDADLDALSNRAELAVYGTDPRRPDSDGDTIKDGEEVSAGADHFVTNPLAADTDGDRFRDALEIRVGSDPTNAASYNLAAAVASLRLAPATFELQIDSLFGTAATTRQLVTTAVLLDGTELDVTSPTWGTSYSDFGNCRVDPDGLVSPFAPGDCEVTAQVGTRTATASVVIRGNPGLAGTLDLPGFANSVAVRGNFAFVASGPAGLLVIDVSNRATPRLAAQLALAGNANDLRLAGDFAYVAADTAGLHVVRISDPLHPVRVATVDTPGLAIDLALDGGYAYVADGPAGLQVIDLVNPLAPVRVGSLDTPGTANGIDVAQGIAVLTDFDHAAEAIDVSVPSAPRRLALLPFNPADPGTRGYDVSYEAPYAYLAQEGSLRTVDLTDPASPVDLGPSGALYLTDVTLTAQKVLFGAATGRVDAALGIYDASRPGAPLPLGELSLWTNFQVGNTTGVTADGRFLYVTATRGTLTSGKPGYSGQTRLYVASYANFTDTAGVPPSVSFEAPADGGTAAVGRPLQVVVRALDDVGVSEVRLSRAGHPVEVDPIPPYTFSLTPGADETEIALEAVAVDFAGNLSAPAEVRVSVVPDGRPTVTIASPAPGDILREGDFNQSFRAQAADDFRINELVLKVNGATLGSVNGNAAEVRFNVPLDVPAMVFEAIATDDAGQTTTTTRTIAIQPDPPPVVTILMPAAGSSVVAGGVLPIQFTVSDDDPFLRSVDLFVNGVETAFAGSAPYMASFPVPGGLAAVTVEARGTDRAGRTTVATRTIPVLDPPPTVALVSPAAGAELAENVPVTLGATATDNLGVASVEFRVDGTSVGVVTAPPFAVPYTVRAGAPSIRIDAIATDTAGQTATAGGTFTVRTNGAPFVELLAPAPGVEWLHGQLATVAVNAEDPDGFSEVRVEIGGEIWYQDSNPPFEFLYQVPDDVSELLIKVTAIDLSGASSSVERTVPVIDDPLTRVVGRVVDGEGHPVAGARVAVIAHTGTTGADGRFDLAGVPTLDSPLRIEALLEGAGAPSYGESNAVDSVRGGTTEYGDIPLVVASGGDLIDGTDDVVGRDRRNDLDITAVHVETLADRLRVRVSLNGGSEAPAYSAVLSFDLDHDRATGVRPLADLFGPHRPSGLGADLELRIDDRVSLDGATFVADDQGFTVEVPLDRLGGSRSFDLLTAVFDYNVYPLGGGGQLAGERLPETPQYLAWDVAPDFGRFRIPALPDLDGDALSFFDEAALGTNSDTFDSDGDGLGDGFEVLYGLDPNDQQDGFGDRDGDGLDENTEEAIGTDPTLADTDGDGVSDGDEETRGTWATEADTDHDGLGDGEEPTTSATLGDSDGDGLLDGRELIDLGTDPNLLDTDQGGAGDGAEAEIDASSPSVGADDRQTRGLGGATVEPRNPAAALDAQGNLHTVFIADNFGHEQLFYRMLGPNGGVKIDSTRLTLTLSPDRPAVAVDGSGKVHIAWSERRFGSGDVFYRVIDPALDDQNGNAADEAAITVVADRRVSSNPDSDGDQPALAVEASGRTHIVWSEVFLGAVRYARYGPTGAVEIAPRPVYEGGGDGQPALRLDDRGGLHVVFSGAFDGATRIGYALIDAASGDLLIAPTAISHGGGNGFDTYPRLSLDGDDRVTVVYDADRRDEARWLRISPYLDDRDGDAADLSTIVDRPEQTLSFPDLPRGNRPDVAIGVDGKVHMVLYDSNPWFGNASTLYYEARNEAGETTVPPTPISNLGEAASRLYEAASLVSGNGRVWAVWTATGGVPVARRIK